MILFFGVLIFGALIGITDDEAYYWSNAQRPAMGYAYHPPAIAWLIGLSQAVFGKLLGIHSTLMIRIPGAVCLAITVALAMLWMERTGLARERVERGSWTLLAFAGLFGLSWMMVPDMPLLLGFTLGFLATWQICFSPQEGFRYYVALAAGLCLMFLSKYSAVLAFASSAVSILFWAPRGRWMKSCGALVAAAVLALIPIISWNATHEWGSILYQIRDRHGDAQVSWIRYGRFWLVEFLLAGPVLVACLPVFAARAMGFKSIEPAETKVYRFLMVWVIPGALIFLTQPLMADFKPHWAFIIWWPLLMTFARQPKGEAHLLVAHRWYSFIVIPLVLASCLLPIGNWIGPFFHHPFDPRLDVTNDLYGWNELQEFISTRLPFEDQGLPVIASRYQTAGHAKFALNPATLVTLLPRDVKSHDEWPTLGVSDGEGPDWPKITTPVLYVSDNRYDEPPRYPQTHCEKLPRFEKMRGGIVAKWIDLWKCVPDGSLSSPK